MNTLNKNFREKFKKINIKHIAAMVIILVVLVFFLSEGTFQSHAVIINEYMGSNRCTIADEDGEYSDWVELKNKSSSPVNLEGYWLSDDATNPLKWQLPAVTLKPGEFLLVFLSGKNRRDPAGPYLHTSFRLSALGETLVLTSSEGIIVDSIETGEMLSNVSRGRKPGRADEWFYYLEPTPGMENYTTGYKVLSQERADDVKVYINEFMTSNKTSIVDDDGDHSDWVELYNAGEEPVNLEGYWLSDKNGNPFKWCFPAVTLEPGGYLLVFASGKNRADLEKGILHTNFSLNDQNDVLVFCTPEGQVINELVIRDIPADVSYGRDSTAEAWLYYPLPTPGEENYTRGFEYLSGKELLQSFNLVINEVMALNRKTVADEDGDFPDWIEIRNAGDAAVNLKGYGLSDREEALFYWQFPETVIEPGACLLVFASGKDRRIPEKPYLHTNFKLKVQGETVFLTHPSGIVMDEMATGMLAPDLSAGRLLEGTLERFFFLRPTPGADNNTAALGPPVPAPVFSQTGGFYSQAVRLELRPGFQAPGTQIRYTLDGREPAEDSPLYTGPLLIEETSIVRARAFAAGRLPSRTVSHSFLIKEDTTLPVISVMMDPADLWDPARGIYVMGSNASPEFPHLGANFWQDWEKPVHFQFFEPDGSLGYSFDAGIKIGGQYSRAMPQKAFNIFARDRYGSSVMEYPFFSENPLTTFKALSLRTSGQDSNLSKLRDTLMTSLLEDTDLDYQDYRFVVLYLNGEYWGIYDLRERINKYFIAYKHDVDPEQVDLLQGNSTVRAGSNKDYLELREFIATNDMRRQENYAYVQTQMDVENFMDYWIAQIFFANTDSANIRFWRERSEEGKWRWIVYDTDWGFFDPNHNTLAYVTNPEGTGVGRRLSTVLLVNLLKNDEFRNEFIRRFAFHLNNTFATERVLERIDYMAGLIEPEMHRHVECWPQGGTLSAWNYQVERLRNFARQRPSVVTRHIREKFNLSSREMEIFNI